MRKVPQVGQVAVHFDEVAQFGVGKAVSPRFVQAHPQGDGHFTPGGFPHVFNDFAQKHPWVGEENIRPKSVAREMFETYSTFADYIKEYGLERSEGLVLRYLSEVYKVLVQTVPPSDRTPELDEIATYFGAIVRQVDSNLLNK